MLDVHRDRLYSTNKCYVEDLFICLLIKIQLLSYILNYLKLTKNSEVVLAKHFHGNMYLIALCDSRSLFYDDHNVK